MPASRDSRMRERVSLTGKAKLFWVDENAPQQAVAEIHDVSAHGMSCWLPRRVATGTRVKVESPQMRLFGFATVRHSRGAGMKYLVGMQFDGNVRWAGSTDTPSTPRWT